MPTPITASLIPLPTTVRSTWVAGAPSAIRMPISLARCATEYAMTP